MALSKSYIDCDSCQSVVHVDEATKGLCEACMSLQEFWREDEVVEIPLPALKKLIGMSKTRHPTVCNQDAFNFEKVLEKKIEGLNTEDDE